MVRTSIILDTAGSYERDLQEMKDNLEHIMPMEFVSTGFDANEVLKTPADLVVIDYGGMSQGYGTYGLCSSAIRAVVDWADNHPSGIVLIWTQFTAMIYEDTISEEFDPGKNNNIWFHWPTKPGGSTYQYLVDMDDKLRRWFGETGAANQRQGAQRRKGGVGGCD